MPDANSDATLPFPFEFSIPGIPVSAWTRNPVVKERWKANVRDRAKARADELVEWYLVPVDPVLVTIFYFPAEPMLGDIDNIVKWILDGMCGVVYADDRLVERVVVQKFEPNLPWRIASVSPVLEAVLDSQPPISYVRVDADLRWRFIP